VIVEDSPVASITAALLPYVDAWKTQAISALDYNILNSALPSRLNGHLEQLRATQEEYEAGLAKLMSDQKEILQREKIDHTKRVVEQMMGVKAANERIIEMLNADVARASLPGP
jgi:flagellar motility protein MotE (MotC chaperone)